MSILKSKRNLNFYIEEFMEYCNLKDLSKKTMKSYESTLLLFSKYTEEEFQIDKIQEIKIKHTKEYIKFTKERGKYSYVSNDKTVLINNPSIRKDFGKTISPATINNYIRNLKVFFTWAVDNKIIKCSPMDKVEFVKCKRKPKDQLSDSDFKALIKALDITKYSEYRDYVIIQLIMDTGMRIGETLALTIEDIDLVRRAILIPADISKGKKDRYVFFSNTMASLLRRWLQFKDRYINNDVLLFPTTRGTQLGIPHFERNFRIYKERANLNKNTTAHGLRNNFAKRCLMSGMDIYILSRLLRHSSVTVLTVTDIERTIKGLIL
ncbi:tyrosine-type recombinase/integrase [Eubacterium multiforme]|uniref:Integrase/recombinase XerD n=1 Tax=Eubacterium multiforme TaxID=83339 RepID=A0ABT9USC5_9FIRM|nr:tyrosine-type recombinase/integrase [Eubacterium multiforme]MDQ0149210.1 integrase/recombinase XerD [Eubacterium multiforme]